MKQLKVKMVIVLMVSMGLFSGMFSLAAEKTAVKVKKDEDRQLKEAALNALLMMKSDKTIPILEKILKNKDNPKLREKAVFILSQQDSDKALPMLVRLAKADPDANIREKAVFWGKWRVNRA